MFHLQKKDFKQVNFTSINWDKLDYESEKRGNSQKPRPR